ncbi:MAG: hypothetical protein V4501_12885 [Pseudomonadota bacterium]
MMTPTEKISSRLLTHRDALIKIGDEFGEAGNQYVIRAGVWLRPVITDFIQMVQDRYDSISSYAETNSTIQKEIVHASDEFFDNAVETLLRVYPTPVRSRVRGITSQIRNEMAILRIDTKAVVEEKLIRDASKFVSHDTDWQKKIVAINNDPAQFKVFLESQKPYRSAAAYILFNNVMLTDAEHSANFYKLAMQSANQRIRNTATQTLRENEITNNNFLNHEAISTQTYQGHTPENYFDAFRRYWLSLPAGNLLFAMAVKKLLDDQALLEHVIRYRVDVKELLFNCLPTTELRRQAIQFILKSDYLDSRCISRLYDELPEGTKVSSRVDAAFYGVQKYLSQPPGLNTDHIEWDNSKQKIRAETFQKILSYYAKASPFIKKVIVYALLLCEGKKLQSQVYRIMGYSQLEVAKKTLRDSIRFDAERMKIDFNQINEDVIHTIIKNTNAKKTFESGVYVKALDKLGKLIPSSQEII